jgi:hypothetical protein
VRLQQRVIALVPRLLLSVLLDLLVFQGPGGRVVPVAVEAHPAPLRMVEGALEEVGIQVQQPPPAGMEKGIPLVRSRGGVAFTRCGEGMQRH